MLRVLTPNKAIVWAANLFVGFWLAALLVPTPLLRILFNSLAFGTGVLITITWFDHARHAMSIKEQAHHGEWQLILGIWFGWFTLTCQRFYSMVFNYYGQPREWLDWPLTAWWPFCFMICGYLFLASPGYATSIPEVRRRTHAYLIVATAIGAFAAGLTLGTSIGIGG